MFTFHGITNQISLIINPIEDSMSRFAYYVFLVKVCILCVSSIVFKTMWIFCQGKIYIALKHSCLNNGDIS